MTAPRICGFLIGSIYLREPGEKFAVTLESALQRDGKTMWAVRSGGNCMNKGGEWELEPCPSNRDDEFIARCRFATMSDGIIMWKLWGEP